MPERMRAISAVWCVWLLTAATALAQGSGGPGGGGGPSGDGPGGGPSGGPRAARNDHGLRVAPPQRPILTPHCGQYLPTKVRLFELVFTLGQARIYQYDENGRPLSARDVRAQMTLQLPGERETQQIRFQYAALPPGTVDQDFVAANFNFAQLRGRETPITIEFAGLPDDRQSTFSFTPLFTMDKVRPYVAQVEPLDADSAAVLRQRICPVCGKVLGSKGAVIKVLIGEYPLYLCCPECMAAVRKTPERFLPQRTAPAHPR